MTRYWVRPQGMAQVGLGLLVAVTVLFFGLSGVSFASEGPRWEINSVSTPTNLVKAKDTIQEITVKTTGAGGIVGVIVPEHGGFFTFSPTATAAELQETLETRVGAGNVEVTGGPGDAQGGKSYVVRFTGGLAGEPVEKMFVVGIGFPNPGTEGATVKLVQTGGSGGELWVTAVNVGGAATDGSKVTIEDTLPAGLTARKISGFDAFSATDPASVQSGRSSLSCSALPALRCTYSKVVEPGDQLTVRINVATGAETPSEVVNSAEVFGGGAEFGASVSNAAQVGETPAGFGIAPGSLLMASSSRQAGAHADVTTGFTMNTGHVGIPSTDTKDLHFDLPQGLVGNTVGMPKCTAARAVNEKCPRDTIVGIASVTLFGGISREPLLFPVFNIEPSPGEPAAFLFNVLGLGPTRLDTSVLSGGDYGVRVTVSDISEGASLVSSYATIWAVPADHQGPGPIDTAYNDKPMKHGEADGTLGGPSSGISRVPLLSNPTQCSSPLSGSMEADDWYRQDVFSSETIGIAKLTGCDQLSFSASMSMLPDTLLAGEPAGYTLKLHVPQVNDPNGLAQPDVKKVVTTLPMGTVISPSAAWGLSACSDSAFGLHSGRPAECPREAQVGTVRITTPALEEAFAGQVYLATPDCGPCTPADAQDGRMVRLFLQAQAESRGGEGVLVKLEGTASINQQTGQVTATFDNNPQLPFSDLQLSLGGGSRATLANPRQCGLATTNMALTPWSTPFTSEIFPSSTFEINQGCIAPRFLPSFAAGTTNIQAGEYAPFTLSFGREDSDEFLNGLQLRMPAGLLGSLANVPLCKEPQGAQGTCDASSEIGHVQALTGPGQTPFLVTGGHVYLTESYRGAPFGLSIVVPAKAGPYTLSGTTGDGNVVVRAAINIDPHTAALTVTSDPLPTVLDGIPLQLRAVNVTIDRPGFTFNPTSCAKTEITGTLTSRESAGVQVSSPFQVTNCAGLGFTPRFKVSTSGRTSRARGASLDAKVVYPSGAKLANIAKVKVSLPKQLPSRLTTLQKACPAQIFDANPGACSAASIIGIAKASTPILPVQLTGPVYFVSHGGEAFPNLIIVLQGYGVRVDLIGDTFINKNGITSSTFNNVPDVPISTFELYLPQGTNSALAANGKLCASNLRMPTVFTAQNGAEIRQSTPIKTTGCPGTVVKAKKSRNARRARRARTARNHHKHKHSHSKTHAHAGHRRSN